MCGNGTLEFIECYRMLASPGAARVRKVPAWICSLCACVLFVRAEHRLDAVRAVARQTRAHAKRGLMKARFVRGRANRALEKSLRLKKHR